MSSKDTRVGFPSDFLSPVQLQTWFQNAVKLHQSGELTEAQVHYENILKLQPQFWDVWHLLGMIANRKGDHRLAVELIQKAIAGNPENPVFHLNLGNALQEVRQLEAAHSSYSKAINLKSDFAEAYFNKANVLHELKLLEESLEHYNKAIEIRPGFAEAYSNRGLVQHELKLFDAAIASYDIAVSLKPNYAVAFANRGNALKELRNFEAAIASYNTAIQWNPGLVDAYVNLGTVLRVVGQTQSALAVYNRAIDISPDHADAHYRLGVLLQELGQLEGAAASYARALANNADHHLAKYALAAIDQIDVPKTAPIQYVSTLFDTYADQYDEHLSNTLKCTIPASLAHQFERYRDRESHEVIDLGCGTGLAGIAFKKTIRSIDGVDLSENMLSKAHERGFYRNLVCSDVISHLQQSAQKYDLAVCADVLVYIGDLEALFSGVSHVLNVGGFFSFSAETSQSKSYELKPSKRYGHSPAYLRVLAEKYGFEIKEIQDSILRMDADASIEGHIVLMRKRR